MLTTRLALDIYGAFGALGRDATADELAAFLAHRIINQYAISELDPAPWCRYDGEDIEYRGHAWEEDHDAFIPRAGYVQDIGRYPGMHPNEKLALDDRPWAAMRQTGNYEWAGVVDRSHTRYSLAGRYDVVKFLPRLGYSQDKEDYNAKA